VTTLNVLQLFDGQRPDHYGFLISALVAARSRSTGVASCAGCG